MLDQIGFDSLVDNEGGTFTFALMTHLSLPIDPILVNTTNVPYFTNGYFVCKETLFQIERHAFTFENALVAVSKSLTQIDYGFELLGIWYNPITELWEFGKTSHYQHWDDAERVSIGYDQDYVFDIKNNRTVKLEYMKVIGGN